MSCGKFWRIWATALRTSLVARSLSVPKTKLMVVVETPSVTVEISWSIFPKLATASSIFFVTWDSNSEGPAPGWVTVMETAGMSMLGLASMPNWPNDVQPTKVRIKKMTSVGTGFLIDQADRFKDI